MKRSIAFFDFDGTITTKDTMLELIKFHHGNTKFLTGFVVLSPWMIMMKAGIISNQLAKEKMLRYFFGGMKAEKFNEVCNAFSTALIPALIRPQALSAIRELQHAGTEVVLVSASAENWLRNWCNNLGIDMIATKLEVKNNLLTGSIAGNNCHGEEKVRRIKAAYNLAAYEDISCYGDTSGDKPMLALGNKSFYKPFRES